MTTRKSIRRTALSALVATLLITGCGGETPESMVASAKDYLAKNDDKAAVIQLKNALQTNPDLAEARFLLGKAMLESELRIFLEKAVSLGFSLEDIRQMIERIKK